MNPTTRRRRIQNYLVWEEQNRECKGEEAMGLGGCWNGMEQFMEWNGLEWKEWNAMAFWVKATGTSPDLEVPLHKVII